MRLLRQGVAVNLIASAWMGTTAAVEPTGEPITPISVPDAEEASTGDGSEKSLAEPKSLEKAVRELLEDKKKRQDAEKAKKAADAKKPTVNWTGQVQSDMLMFTQDAASKAVFGDIPNGSVIRRARFGMFGQHELTEYRIEMDFAFLGRPTFLDVYAGLINPQTKGVLRVGHFFEPFSLERMTPNRFMTFLERSLMDQAFAPVRNLGVVWKRPLAEEHVTAAVGIFRTDSDFYGDDTGDLFEHAITGRLTWLPYYRESTGDRYLMLGTSGSFRGANNHLVRFRAQPEVRLGATIPNVPFMADTGNIPATHSFLLGTEAVWVHGPFSVQAEYAAAPVASLNFGTLWFQGWY
ncbi:MAG: porin, partial [Gemmataceae bacterium]|nr:porin [Gemmataceae bacterium]